MIKVGASDRSKYYVSKHFGHFGHTQTELNSLHRIEKIMPQ